ncbi:MAG: ATP-binding cassette domain-containing protein [Gammaproteobacteria bacterium]|jgi:ABC-2 type transport system ATP-binding protein
MIEVKRVSRDYAGQKAVDEISFAIGRGEIVGLLGHNGAGKSTVMKMLAGCLEPSSGEIRVAGRSMLRESAAIRGLIGYLPENCPLYADMRVMDYLYLQADLKGIAAAAQDGAVVSVLRRTQLEARATSRIATLSRGLRQRVGVAQALLAGPQLLILDEPTNGLDPSQIEQMRWLIREAAASATVVVSTHILQEVEAVCDRVLILRNGRLVVDQPLSAFQESNSLYVIVDSPGGDVRDLLAGFAPVEQDDGGYLLACAPDRMRSTALEVSKLLADRGIGLVELRPVRHSLEQLFREVQEPGVQSHA